jgi:integrase
MGWLLREGKVAGLLVNPCLRGSGVQRNPESKRERYVDDAEYRDVWACADRAVRLLIALTYRTLQRPESDIIRRDRQLIKVQAGARVLDFRQHKTGRRMTIAFTPELDELLPADKVVQLHGGEPDPRDPAAERRLLHLRRAELDAQAGDRAAEGARTRRDAVVRLPRPEGQGRHGHVGAGVPLETIQALLGHANKTTTEIYVKQRWREAVQPNRVQLGR